MKYLPCKELTKVLLPAYTKCCILTTNCSELKYDPTLGHVPRGFCGAFGSLADVKLVLVLAEPGNPKDKSWGVPKNTKPNEHLKGNIAGVLEAIKKPERKRGFHENVGIILNECWPDLTLEEQFERTWMTESVLCSAKYAAGKVPRPIEQACAETYLRRQLDLLPKRFVVALGDKAKKRLGMIGVVYDFAASAPGRPEGPKERALQSWKELGKAFRKHLQKNG